MKCGVIAGERRLHVAPVLEEVAGRTLVGLVYRRECKLKPCQQCAWHRIWYRIADLIILSMSLPRIPVHVAVQWWYKLSITAIVCVCQLYPIHEQYCLAAQGKQRVAANLVRVWTINYKLCSCLVLHNKYYIDLHDRILNGWMSAVCDSVTMATTPVDLWYSESYRICVCSHWIRKSILAVMWLLTNTQLLPRHCNCSV